MEINFKCKKCKKEFNCETGKIGINKKEMRPEFEKDIICPRCGRLRINEVLLTETGQSQMTEATFDF